MFREIRAYEDIVQSVDHMRTAWRKTYKETGSHLHTSKKRAGNILKNYDGMNRKPVAAYRSGRMRTTTEEDDEAIFKAIANPFVFLSMAYQEIRKQEDFPKAGKLAKLVFWIGLICSLAVEV